MIIVTIFQAIIIIILILRLYYLKHNWINNSNKLLYEILSNSAEQQDYSVKLTKTINTIKEFFKLDYLTLFLYDEKDRQKLSLLASNVGKQYLDKIVKRGQQVLKDTESKNDAYIEYSKTGLYYESAKKRNIKYMYFVKLILNKEIIGALLVENMTNTGINVLEIDFFKSVIDSVTIYLQNVKCRRLELEQMNKDGLTGTLNRKIFDADMREITRKCYELGEKYSIVMLDIDHFKMINDNYGHQCGDEALKTLVNIITESIRDGDNLYRYGGEEFCIILPNTTPDDIVKRINEIRIEIQKKEISYNGQRIHITCSFGIAGLPCDLKDPIEIVSRADKALYESKNAGRNRVTVYQKLR